MRFGDSSARNKSTVWEGLVEVFRLHGHPKTDRVYAWMHDPKRPKRHVTVLDIHPISSEIEAVRATIIKDFRDDQESQESKKSRTAKTT